MFCERRQQKQLNNEWRRHPAVMPDIEYCSTKKLSPKTEFKWVKSENVDLRSSALGNRCCWNKGI